MRMRIPEWADRANIYIMAGVEPFMKREKGIWYVKKVRCNNCGKCCMNVPEKWSHGQDEDGNCQHLAFDGVEYSCDLKVNRPFKCCTGDGEPEDCCIEWRVAN